MKLKTDSALSCATCGQTLAGKFCHVCGEKKLNKEDFTVKSFFHQAIDVFTHFDSKVLRSIRLLITKPGFLTYEYLHGRRVHYSKPLQLFFVINIIYFLVLNYVGFDVVTNPLGDHENHFIYGGFATSLVDHKLESGSISPAEYESKFYATIYADSKILIIFIIPMLAFFMKLIYLRERKLYYEHLVFVTYLICFIMLYYTFFLNALDYIAYFLSLVNVTTSYIILFNDTIASIITIAVLFVYLFFSLKKVYQQSSGITIIKTVLTMLSLILVVSIYSFIMFLLIYSTI